MTAKLTERDRWMLAILPAFLMVCFYSWLFLRPASREIRLLRGEMATQEPLAVLEAKRDAAGAESTRLSSELARLKSAAATNAALAPSAFHRSDRAGALQHLTSLCDQRGVTLVRAASESTEAAVGVTNQVWRLELRGAFADVNGLLGAIVAEQVAAIPVELSMTRAENNAGLTAWVLKVWL